MSDEIKTEKEHKCICQSEFFRKFLVVALGSFVGVFCALSLFAALHKPPMPPCPFRGHFVKPYPCHMERFDNAGQMEKPTVRFIEFEKKIPKKVQKIDTDD